jgi:hypothetical protein
MMPPMMTGTFFMLTSWRRLVDGDRCPGSGCRAVSVTSLQPPTPPGFVEVAEGHLDRFGAAAWP